MSFRGHVQNGVIVFDESAGLPEGTEVRIDVVEEPRSNDEPPSLYERLKAVLGQANGLPADASMNVDHYLYGHPKR